MQRDGLLTSLRKTLRSVQRFALRRRASWLAHPPAAQLCSGPQDRPPAEVRPSAHGSQSGSMSGSSRSMSGSIADVADVPDSNDDKPSSSSSPRSPGTAG